VDAIHRYVGYSIPTAFLILAVWALVAFVRNKNPGGPFWTLLAAIQVVLAVQVVIGAILFLMGERPESNGPQWLHYVYGGVFPGALLVFAHRWARGDRFKEIPWAVFGIVAFVCFGLTFRAVQTGLGID
jgi:heme A synthase